MHAVRPSREIASSGPSTALLRSLSPPPPYDLTSGRYDGFTIRQDSPQDISFGSKKLPSLYHDLNENDLLASERR